jgi:hypothetical protein
MTSIADPIFYVTNQYYLEVLFFVIKPANLVMSVKFCAAGMGNILPLLVDMDCPLNFNAIMQSKQVLADLFSLLLWTTLVRWA